MSNDYVRHIWQHGKFKNFKFFKRHRTNTMSSLDKIKCHITVDYINSLNTHSILGFLEIKFPPETKLHRITIEVTGVAKSKWTLKKTLFKFPKIYRKGTVFTGKQMFYYCRHTIAGDENLDVPPVTISGYKLFKFKCGLPDCIPGTYKGTHGAILYTGRVTIIVGNLQTKSFSQKLTIYAKRNLALEKHLLHEQREDVCRKFKLGIIDIGNVQISVWLPISAIAAGQSLPLICTVTNNTRLVFGGIVFVLTQIEVYRSNKPTLLHKTVRKDICRVARIVNIIEGKSVYYCALKTNKKTRPTNQFWRCRACQLIYEVWVVLQGAFRRHGPYHNPNVYTPGIPVIIGTEPLLEWDSDKMFQEIMTRLYAVYHPVEMEPLAEDEEVEKLLINVDEELDEAIMLNLARQIEEVPAVKNQECEME